MTIVHEVSMPSVIAQIQLRVRFERTAGVRLWLGVRVMKLAALVAGCGIVVELPSASEKA